MSELEIIGWIGSILLAICALPEVIVSLRTKKCDLSWAFLILWILGEILVLIPILFKIKEAFLIANYSVNIIFISILIYYKRRKNE